MENLQGKLKTTKTRYYQDASSNVLYSITYNQVYAWDIQTGDNYKREQITKNVEKNRIYCGMWKPLTKKDFYQIFRNKE